MTTTTATWIDAALSAAKSQSWFALVREEQVRDDLEEWAEDGMFKAEKQVRDRLCQFCQQQIEQMGKANFRCTL